MDIIYAAEKPSIAKVLEDYIKESVEPDEIRVRANPNETGSFLIGWRFRRYVLAPNGESEAFRAGLVAAKAELDRDFDTSAAPVSGAIDLIDQLLDLDIAPRLPDISRSLTLLRSAGGGTDAGNSPGGN